ncbi:MAG: type II toxin-antitoxin system RelE/ParE family toxin [Candidatus Peregrinibacteria bacterium]
MRVRYTDEAELCMKRLPRHIARRIADKIDWYAEQKVPLSFARRLWDPVDTLFRFRIGDYRAIFRLEGCTLEIILILTVKHRKEVYRGV